MAQSNKAPSRTPDARSSIFLLAIGVLALGLGTRSPAADKPASTAPSGMTRREALERFRALSPEARLTLALDEAKRLAKEKVRQSMGLP